jgi:hypothetical protein
VRAGAAGGRLLQRCDELFQTRLARERLAALGIAVKTVETLHRRIREKRALRSADELRERAQRWPAAHGWLDLGPRR